MCETWIYLHNIFADKNPDECQIKGEILVFIVGYIALFYIQ